MKPKLTPFGKFIAGILKEALAIILITLLLLAVAWPARADGFNNYGVVPVIAGGTNNVAAATTNSAYATTLAVQRQEFVAYRISFSCTATNDKTMVFRLKPSLDGSTADNLGTSWDLSVVANGTNTVNFVTNVNVGAIGYFKLTQIENPNATAALTNLSFDYVIKR